ncbi:MAG TPA: cation transporter [Candidatus Avacidaminococcus intestinavium]|uniref:Cation transporter n=1 Tax=Candidatus Avacidaminococcus intestinavium TaxID=2840684 RepID=A0A9D1SKY3_9FIRM|nr:cation transporter [Candidatus Avacidaminococcus intestinavium]
MKKSFRLENLGCAHCATQMEEAINKLPEVQSASINFMTTKLIVELEKEHLATVVTAVQKIIKDIEPDVELVKA